MSRVVLFFDGRSPLYLRDVRRDADGRVKSGYVVNGDWNFEIRGDECLAKSGNSIVNRWQLDRTLVREVVVPPEIQGHYDDVIAWAEKQLSLGVA